MRTVTGAKGVFLEGHGNHGGLRRADVVPRRHVCRIRAVHCCAGSHATIWSPDSRSIVFTALAADGTAGLYIARSDGNITPRFITSGDEAFWSRK
jgi:hypothetical protein